MKITKQRRTMPASSATRRTEQLKCTTVTENHRRSQSCAEIWEAGEGYSKNYFL